MELLRGDLIASSPDEEEMDATRSLESPPYIPRDLIVATLSANNVATHDKDKGSCILANYFQKAYTSEAVLTDA